jgi:hypothetical protein
MILCGSSPRPVNRLAGSVQYPRALPDSQAIELVREISLLLLPPSQTPFRSVRSCIKHYLNRTVTMLFRGTKGVINSMRRSRFSLFSGECHYNLAQCCSIPQAASPSFSSCKCRCLAKSCSLPRWVSPRCTKFGITRWTRGRSIGNLCSRGCSRTQRH